MNIDFIISCRKLCVNNYDYIALINLTMRFSHNVIVHNFLYLARNIYEPNPYPSRMGVARRIFKKGSVEL